LRGLFVSGTDTEAGKSVVAAAICASLAAQGERVGAFKPVVTGLDEPVGYWPRDHELLAAAAGSEQAPGDVAPYRFGPAVSPHLAAEDAGEAIDPVRVESAARAIGDGTDVLVVEGVGGLMVPLTPGYLVRDLAVALALPLVVAARPGLGTINHCLLTLEAARAAGLRVAAVVMSPWPEEPSAMEASNRETVQRLGGVPVAGLPATTPEDLSAAGAALRAADWL
jgi:dethiobiotin synthetase